MSLFIDCGSSIFIHPLSYFLISLSHIFLQKWNWFKWISAPTRVERERSRILWLQKWKMVKGFCFVSVAMQTSEYFQIASNYFCCVVMCSLSFMDTWAIVSPAFCSSIAIDRESKKREWPILRNWIEYIENWDQGILYLTLCFHILWN